MASALSSASPCAATSMRPDLATPSSCFRALVEQRCDSHPRLSQFEELFTLLLGTRHARRRNAFLSDLTVFVGPGHVGATKRMPPFEPWRLITLLSTIGQLCGRFHAESTCG